MNWMRRKGRSRAPGKGADGAGLRETGNALDQHMAAGEQGDQETVEEPALTYDGLFETGEEAPTVSTAASEACVVDTGSFSSWFLPFTWESGVGRAFS